MSVCQLPKAVENRLTLPSTIKCLMDAHIITNEFLHKDANIDDTLSGTTSISVLFVGNKIFVSNVGDSRAILVYKDTSTGALAVVSLSHDQVSYLVSRHSVSQSLVLCLMSV